MLTDTDQEDILANVHAHSTITWYEKMMVLFVDNLITRNLSCLGKISFL